MNTLKQPVTLGEKASFVNDLIFKYQLSIPSGTTTIGIAMRAEYGDVVGMEVRFYRITESVNIMIGSEYIAGIRINAGFRVNIDWLHPDIRSSVGASSTNKNKEHDVLVLTQKYIDTKLQYDNIRTDLRSIEKDLLSIGIDPKTLKKQ